MNSELRDLYHGCFEVCADIGANPEMLAAAQRLRYQVYCVEQQWEPPERFPDGVEVDEFDARSLHSLLIQRTSGQVAGTVRLIRADAQRPLGSLPIDQLCHDPDLADGSVVPRATVGEVSRFAISKAFRRRAEDQAAPGCMWPERGAPLPEDSRRRLPHLSVGLVAAMVESSHRHGITHWVAEMEPALLRMYAHLGVHWRPLGPVIEWRGKRQPCVTELGPMLERARQERPDIWDLITNGGEWSFPRPEALPEPPDRARFPDAYSAMPVTPHL